MGCAMLMSKKCYPDETKEPFISLLNSASIILNRLPFRTLIYTGNNDDTLDVTFFHSFERELNKVIKAFS